MTKEIKALAKVQEEIPSLVKEFVKMGIDKYMVLQCFLDEYHKISADEKSNMILYNRILSAKLSEVMEESDEMQVTTEMYTKLFNGITDLKNDIYINWQKRWKISSWK